MARAHRPWLAIVCFSSWAFGPAIGVGLAVHELEHHGSEAQDHSHVSQSAAVVLHGHFHEDDSDDHSHELAPPSSTPLRLGHDGQDGLTSVTSKGAMSLAGSDACSHRRSPDPTALAPPDLFGLCVLRL